MIAHANFVCILSWSRPKQSVTCKHVYWLWKSLLLTWMYASLVWNCLWCRFCPAYIDTCGLVYGIIRIAGQSMFAQLINAATWPIWRWRVVIWLNISCILSGCRYGIESQLAKWLKLHSKQLIVSQCEYTLIHTYSLFHNVTGFAKRTLWQNIILRKTQLKNSCH